MAVSAVPAQGASGLAGHWRFNEGSGTNAADASGNGHTGALSGGPAWVSGHFGSALNFDAAGDDVRVPTTAALAPATVSVAAWVRRSGSPGNFKYLLAKGASGCIASSYALYTGSQGGLRFYVSGADGADYTLSPDAGAGVWDGAWHHVVGTFGGSAVRLYVDGTEVGTGTPRSAPIDYTAITDNDVVVGRYTGCSGLDFTGTIDEPKIFDHALDLQEVEQAALNYEFVGFFSPVNNLPQVNVVKAGSAVPVKFSLTGYQGMTIFDTGSPSSQRVSCDSDAPLDAIEQTVSPGSSAALSYDAETDRYQFVWKTEKSWSGTCRKLKVTFDDGTIATAQFKLK